MLPPLVEYGANLVAPYETLARKVTKSNTICSHEQAYWSIIITVLPLWALLTAILVIVLIQFHRTSRSTKIYDNCTKANAHYVYHIELRTGDTSVTFNRRRTTITIDMFDDSQNTLARIAIPGHVIFGGKETPVVPVIHTESDNDRFSELRCTRLWLYRAARLKRISTIRITHSCLDQDARIMIFGVELRSNEIDKHKLFFPVMHYISAYGSVAKPNACFDFDPMGSISALGGRVSDSSSNISDQLSLIDYAIMAYLYCSLLFYFSTFDTLPESFLDTLYASYKGIILGSGCYFLIFILIMCFKITVKHQYSINIGIGAWANAYIIICIMIMFVSTAIWVYVAVIAYKQICSNYYSLWLLSISLAILTSLLLALLCFIIYWLVQTFLLNSSESINFPEDLDLPFNQVGLAQYHSVGSKQAGKFGALARSSRQQMVNSSPGVPVVLGQQQAAGWPTASPQVGYGAAPPPPPAQAYGTQQLGYAPGGATQPNLYKTPYLGVGQTVPQYDTGQLAHQYYPAPQAQQPVIINQRHSPGRSASPSAPPQPAQQQQQQQAVGHKSPSYQQQTQQPAIGGGIKPSVKKVGSNESTGSTYYQQLMKTKGGVKSISQYGELIKQQKRAQKKQ